MNVVESTGLKNEEFLEKVNNPNSALAQVDQFQDENRKIMKKFVQLNKN